MTNENTDLASSTAGSLSTAERMRLHRQRRKLGLRCFRIQLRSTEIDALVRRGLLKPDARNDKDAVVDAFNAFLDDALT